jgi:hypothetical protein
MIQNTNTCTGCTADLTIPESVSRRYVNKDDPSGDSDMFAEGHYLNCGTFESDSFGGFDGDRYDCLDNSDTCISCETQL